VAAISGCHMFSLLYFSAQCGFVVRNYVDNARGVGQESVRGQFAISRVTLGPDIAFFGERAPSTEELKALHHIAQDRCLIADPFKCEVVVEPVDTISTGQIDLPQQSESKPSKRANDKKRGRADA
jgi:organic hydroperoxide reductase OsmC/OhrA